MALKLNHPRKVLQLMSTAMGLLQTPVAWTRYTMARNKEQQPVGFADTDAQMFCLAGALHRANADLGMSPEVVAEAEALVNQVCIGTYGPIISKHGSEKDIWEFHLYPLSYTNDALIHSQKNAQGLLDKIHALLDKRLGRATAATPPPAPEPPPVPSPEPPPPATPEAPAVPPPEPPPLSTPEAPAVPPPEPPPLSTPEALAVPPPEPPAIPLPTSAQAPAASTPGSAPDLEIVQDSVQHHPVEQQAVEAEDENQVASSPELPKIDLPGIEIDMDLDEPA